MRPLHNETRGIEGLQRTRRDRDIRTHNLTITLFFIELIGKLLQGYVYYKISFDGASEVSPRPKDHSICDSVRHQAIIQPTIYRKQELYTGQSNRRTASLST